MIRCQPALGTFIEIEACHSQEVQASENDNALSFAIDQAFAAIQIVQRCMSVFDLNSNLSQINAGKFQNQSGAIHPWLWEVLQLAKEIHALSSDFDPSATIYLMHQGMRPQIKKISETVLGSLDDLVLLDDYRVVTKKPVYIDLGGIAKGAAVDSAIDALQTHGVTSGGINAGGDLRVFGSEAHSIYLRHPRAPQCNFYAGKLQDGALATSGDYFVSQGGDAQQKKGHLISPKHKLPIQTKKSFSVIAPICAVADALTKVYAISGDAQHPALRHFGAQAIEVTA